MTIQDYKELTEKILNGDKQAFDTILENTTFSVLPRVKVYFKHGLIPFIEEDELVYRACLASKRYIERYVEQGSFPKTLSSFIYEGKEFACHKLYNLNKKRSKVNKETNISYEWLVKQESYGNEKEYQYCDGEIEKTEHNIDNSLIKKSFKQFLKYLPEQSQKIAKKYYGIDSECLSKRQIIKEEKTYWAKLYKVLNNVTTDFAEYYKEREENELEKV